MSTWAIGDVHGCGRELTLLLQRIPADDTVVLVGDLYTKGPDPVRVWELIQQRHLVAVLGNHDARLIRRFEGRVDAPDPHADEVIGKLDATGHGWREHLLSLPLFLEIDDWTIVHAAIHPSGSLERTKRKDFLVRRRWPDDRPTDPRWWKVYKGSRRVVFGHDAAKGLVRVLRKGKPLLLGLDSGCVYGGALTAVCLTTDRVIQTPAARAYCPIQVRQKRR